jgi:hypothetical protein
LVRDKFIQSKRVNALRQARLGEKQEFSESDVEAQGIMKSRMS